MGLIGSLTGVFHLSKDEAKELIKSLYEIEISDGSVINIEERVAIALRPINERIHGFVTESIFCKHFDETSWRDKGTNHYVWVAATKQAVCYRINRQRDKEAFWKIAGNLNPIAPIVTDRYGAYNKLANPHQFCVPHLIRNVRKFAQRKGVDGIMGLAIEKELQYLTHTHAEYRKKVISKICWSQRLRRCRKRMEELFLDVLVSASKDFGDFCEKLLFDDFEKLWTFRKYQDVEPSNNLAERDLRRIVLWRKKSYGTRSERGKVFVQTISSVVGTLRRAGRNVVHFLTEAVIQFFSGAEAPKIQPIYGF